MLYLGVLKLWRRNKVRQCNYLFGLSQCLNRFGGFERCNNFLKLFEIRTFHYHQSLPLFQVDLDSGQNEK